MIALSDIFRIGTYLLVHAVGRVRIWYSQLQSLGWDEMVNSEPECMTNKSVGIHDAIKSAWTKIPIEHFHKVIKSILWVSKTVIKLKMRSY